MGFDLITVIKEKKRCFHLCSYVVGLFGLLPLARLVYGEYFYSKNGALFILRCIQNLQCLQCLISTQSSEIIAQKSPREYHKKSAYSTKVKLIETIN